MKEYTNALIIKKIKLQRPVSWENKQIVPQLFQPVDSSSFLLFLERKTFFISLGLFVIDYFDLPRLDLSLARSGSLLISEERLH